MKTNQFEYLNFCLFPGFWLQSSGLLKNFSEFPYSKNSKPRKRFSFLFYGCVKRRIKGDSVTLCQSVTLVKKSYGAMAVYQFFHWPHIWIIIKWKYYLHFSFCCILKKSARLFQPTPFNWLTFVRLVKNRKQWNSPWWRLFFRLKTLSLEKSSLFVCVGVFFFNVEQNNRFYRFNIFEWIYIYL